MIGQPVVVTIAHGRHEHLRRQLTSLARADPTVAHVVVAMGDDDVRSVVDEQHAGQGGDVVVVPVGLDPDGELPLARARNAGAETALAMGGDLLIFLDVDCLAAPELVGDYRRAADRSGSRPEGPVLWCGEVSYLPPLSDDLPDYPMDALDTLASAHPARPVLEPGGIRFDTDTRMFWSLNFAMTASDWRRSGGFHEGFRGYGGEDTDLAMAVGAQHGVIGWIGGARAFHQHHPTSSPPWQHLPAIVRNARLFRDRWGRFPMEGWLQEFAEAGAVDYDPVAGVLRLRV